MKKASSVYSAPFAVAHSGKPEELDKDVRSFAQDFAQ